MKRLKAAAVDFGIGAVIIYLILLIPSIASEFTKEFVSAARQTLITIFGICVFGNWKGIFEEGERLGPRVLSLANIVLDILNIVLKRNKDEK